MENKINNQLMRDFLVKAGAPEDKVDRIIEDVNNLAIARAFDKSLDKWPEDLRNQVVAIANPEEMENFLNVNEGKYPKVTDNELQKELEDTWSDYLKEIE